MENTDPAPNVMQWRQLAQRLLMLCIQAEGFAHCARAFLLSEHTETQMCDLGLSVVSTGKGAGRLDRGACKVLRNAVWTPKLSHWPSPGASCSCPQGKTLWRLLLPRGGFNKFW